MHKGQSTPAHTVARDKRGHFVASSVPQIMVQINEDLQNERKKCSFKVEELTYLIDGSPEKTADRRRKDELLLSNKEIFEGVPEEYLDDKGRYHKAVKNSVIIFGLLRRLQNDGKLDLINYRDLVSSIISSGAVRDGTPLALQYIMFMPAILNLGNEEQAAYWLGRAWNCSILGSYAQTELGHGTFIRGLETTATYDPETKEFILHSPTLSSYKWWPGGLGHTANYCIVVAQLYTKGKCHGIHSFIVQVRDEESHMPLKGIKIGDIGTKMALHSVNNGFLGFDQYRIPRNHMLMKHAQVLEDGTYVKSRNSKLNYGAMVFVRVLIVYDMVKYLSKGVTIATRYSAVRRQCTLKDGEPECQILDYVTQQHKIFIGISSSYALKETGIKLWDTFQDINDQLNDGNLERLPELHALACCLKAVSTSDTATIIERCRLACGGHGYMHSSNLPLTYAHVTAACTYEGENTVLLLQTARFLVKTWQQVDSLPLTPTVSYLKRASAQGYAGRWQNSVEGIIAGFEVVSMKKISSCVDSMQKRMDKGMSIEDAWNMTSVQLVDAAEMHCRVFIISAYNEATHKMGAKVTSELRVVLYQLLELYAVYWALERSKDLLRYTSISNNDIDDLQLWYEELLCKIRPNAVGLVDAFDFRDEAINSTLGSYDGRVYERLMEEAMKSPLNQEPVNDSFHKYLKPFMQGKL